MVMHAHDIRVNAGERPCNDRCVIDVDVDRVRNRLGLGAEHDDWLGRLAGVEPPRVVLPNADTAADLFPLLGIAAEDGADLLAHRPDRVETPELWWLLERCVGGLLTRLGSLGPDAPWPDLPPTLGARGRLFPAWVYLGALPAARAWHGERGIPDDVSWSTLADLGLHLAIHRRVHGVVGLDAPWWLQPHFRGALLRLGRLQFARTAAPFGSPPPPDFAGLLAPGAIALEVHIPEDGPLDAHACDAAFAAARDLLPRWFPEKPVDLAVCASWLLDDQLRRYLPEGSNILRFQQRFTLLEGAVGDGDRDIVFFVFRRPGGAAEDLPRRTRLERAVADHLASGGHWRVRRGWCRL
jgi:hypothetical protein